MPYKIVLFLKRCFSVFVAAVFLLLFQYCSNVRNSGVAGTLSDTAIVAPGATPQLVARQFAFTEGPAVDKEGNVFFTDQPNNKIWKWSTDGKLSVFMDSSYRSNGLYFDPKGNLVSCAEEKDQLLSFGKNGEVTVLLDDVAGKRLNGPNDLWIAPNGDIYFTDPYYQRPWWTRTKPDIEGQHVYLLRQGQKEAVRVIDNLTKPNGIVGTPDGRTLYVADIEGKKTYRYTIQPDGSLQNASLFADMGSDGMTVDNRGNVYLTGNGVTVFNTNGEKIKQISLPGWTANVVFGGRKKDQLFITANTAVYTLQMQVRGVQ